MPACKHHSNERKEKESSPVPAQHAPGKNHCQFSLPLSHWMVGAQIWKKASKTVMWFLSQGFLYKHVRDTGEKHVRRDICTPILCKLLSCSPVNIPVPRIFPMMTAGCSSPWEEDGCFLLWVWKCCSWKRGGWEIQRESSHVVGAGGLSLPALKMSPNWYQGCRHYVKGRSKSISITQSCFQTGKSNHLWTLAKYM